MPQSSKTQNWQEIIIVVIGFAFGWKIIIYFAWPYAFCEDSFSFIRFLLLIVLLLIYHKAFKLLSFRTKLSRLFVLFLLYGIVLYGFDILIHLVVDTGLKYNYLNDKYAHWYSDDSVKEEVKNYGRLATIDESVNAAILRDFTLLAFVKRFLTQLVVYIVFSVALVVFFNKYEFEPKKN